MKEKSTVLLVAAITMVYGSTTAQIKRIWTGEGDGLKGRVKTDAEYRSMNFGGQGRQLVKLVVSSYDKRGHKTEETWRADTTSGSGNRLVYSYNDDGMFTEKDRYQMIDNSPDGKFVYEYDKSHNRVEIKEYSAEGRPGYTEIHKYDKNGRETEVNVCYDKKKVHTDSYKYDDANNFVETDLDYSENFDGSLAPQKILTKYDVHGNPAETIYQFPDSSMKKQIWTSKYGAMDSAGNWLHVTNYKDGKEFDEIDRKIGYY